MTIKDYMLDWTVKQSTEIAIKNDKFIKDFVLTLSPEELQLLSSEYYQVTDKEGLILEIKKKQTINAAMSFDYLDSILLKLKEEANKPKDDKPFIVYATKNGVKRIEKESIKDKSFFVKTKWKFIFWFRWIVLDIKDFFKKGKK
jgi:hypothetical protein